MTTQTLVYENTLKIMQNALDANLASQEDLQWLKSKADPVYWLREYATVQLYLGRRAGHTTAALKISAEFENPILITINSSIIDLNRVKEINYSVSLFSSPVKLFSAHALSALVDNPCDLLIVESNSISKKEVLDQIYAYAAKAKVRCVLLIG